MRAPLLLVLGLLACTRSPDPANVAPAASVSAATTTPASRAAPCTPWGNPGFRVAASNVAGRADFERVLRFDDATGVVSVHDSDPFANGKEEKVPRVIDRSMTLAPDEHRALTVDLFQICPDAAALARRCAPGGCAHLEVTSDGNKVVVEDARTVGAVMRRLERYFPELRK